MRRFLLYLVLLLMPVLLAGCGGEGKQPAAETRAAPVTIEFWHSEPADNLETMERLVARFNASQQQVKVQPIFQGNDEELMIKLMLSLSSGTAPALVYAVEANARWLIDSGFARPVQDFIDRDEYDLSGLDEKTVGYYTVDGKLWAMPFGVVVQLLYYDKAAFREAGLDPDRPPRDLAEVRQYSEKILQRATSAQVERTGLAMEIHPWFLELALAQHGDFYADNGNGRDGRPTRVLFNSEAGRWFLRWWHDTVKGGLTLNTGRGGLVDAFVALATGRAAMVFGGSSGLRALVNALGRGQLPIEFAAADWPGIPGTSLPGVWTRALWILTQRPEEEQEAAWQFIQWLMEPEQQAEWFAGTGYLPVQSSALDLPTAREVVAQYPLFQVPLDIYLDAPFRPASLGPLLGPMTEVRNEVAEAIEETIAGSADPADALRQAEDRANAIIQEYNQRVGR